MDPNESPMDVWPRFLPLCWLAAVWSSLTGILGLLMAGVVYVVDGNVRLMPGRPFDAMEWVVSGRLGRLMWSRKWAAVTMGWCVFYWTEASVTPQGRNHERRHIWQQLVWGPAWLPAYAICWLVGFARYRITMEAYQNNPFEADARKWAESIVPITQ